MKMITLFLPEKYLEMLDTLVAANLYPNRSEALRMATWKFLHESVAMLKAVPANTTSRAKHPVAASAKSAPSRISSQQANPIPVADLDGIHDEIDGGKAISDEGFDPFDEIFREQQHA
nr:ribbon-helix-helix domain-containing protein [Candidatus Sigynarchaeum springense]